MVPSITASHPGPEAAKQPQTITLPPPCLTAGIMFILWNPVLVLCQMQRDTHTFQKLSHQSTEYFPQILEDNGDIFWQIWDKPVFFLVSSGFFLGTFPWMPFLSILFIIFESWTLTFMLFWVLLWPPVWALREMSRSCTPGKVHHCYKFSPCVDNGSDRGLLESQRLRNCFYLNYSSFQTDTCQLFCSSSVLVFL